MKSYLKYKLTECDTVGGVTWYVLTFKNGRQPKGKSIEGSKEDWIGLANCIRSGSNLFEKKRLACQWNGSTFWSFWSPRNSTKMEVSMINLAALELAKYILKLFKNKPTKV